MKTENIFNLNDNWSLFLFLDPSSREAKVIFLTWNNKTRQEIIWLTSVLLELKMLLRCSVFSACLSFGSPSSSRSFEQKKKLVEAPIHQRLSKRKKGRRRNINYLDFHKLLEKTRVKAGNWITYEQLVWKFVLNFNLECSRRQSDDIKLEDSLAWLNMFIIWSYYLVNVHCQCHETLSILNYITVQSNCCLAFSQWKCELCTSTARF